MPQKRQPKTPSAFPKKRRSKKQRARGTKKYDWVSLIKNLIPGKTIHVEIPKDCHRAANPPLVCAKRLGIRIATTCVPLNDPECVCPPGGTPQVRRVTALLSITRLAEPVAIP